MCYYFDDIIKTEGFDFNNILLDGKSYEFILLIQNLLIKCVCVFGGGGILEIIMKLNN